jgi:hypothetical protein
MISLAQYPFSNMPLADEKLKRIVHFYELVFSFQSDNPAERHDKIRAVFNDVVHLAHDRDRARYQTMNQKFLFINEISFVPDERYIKGKLLSIKKDLLPELMDMDNDVISDLPTNEAQGIVETTHFIVYYGGRRVYLALEYNDTGAKIQEFIYYINSVPKRNVDLLSLGKLNIVRDNINEIERRIKEISSFRIRLHKDNEQLSDEFDGATATALRSLLNIDNVEYADIDVKFSGNRVSERAEQTSNEAETPKNAVRKMIDSVRRGRINKENVKKILVVAKDEDDNDRTAVFDLLFDNVKSYVRVSKKPNSRTVLSEEMYSLMWQKLVQNRLQ